MQKNQLRFLLAAAAVLIVAGCMESKGVVPPQDAQGRYVILLTDELRFEPADARVPVGATVVWVNNGTQPHDVTGYYGDALDNDLRFESPLRQAPGWSVDAGMSYNFTLVEKGTYTIWCHRHHEADMQGILRVS